MWRLVAECRPSIVFGEQVASSDGRVWLAGVSASLEILGFAVGSADLCAPSVGAPHIRQRLWWVAHPAGYGGGVSKQWVRTQSNGGGETGGVANPQIERRSPVNSENERSPVREDDALTDASETNRLGNTAFSRERARQGEPVPGTKSQESPGRPDLFSGVADTGRSSNERRLRPEEAPGTPGTAKGEIRKRPRRRIDTGRSSGVGGVADSNEEQRHGGRPARRRREQSPDGSKMGAPKIEKPQRERSHQVETSEGRAGLAGSPGGDEFWNDAVWIPCGDGRARRIGPGVFPLAHGLPRNMANISAAQTRLAAMAGIDGASLKRAKSYRLGTLRGSGNAIVPQVAATFIEAAREAIEKGD